MRDSYIIPLLFGMGIYMFVGIAVGVAGLTKDVLITLSSGVLTTTFLFLYLNVFDTGNKGIVN